MVDRDTVKQMAHLARLRINKEEIAEVAQDMSRILHWIDRLAEVDIANTEPFVWSSRHVQRPSVLRTDSIQPTPGSEAILAQAPHTEGGFFVVPKVVE